MNSKQTKRMLEVILTDTEIAERSKAMSKLVINKRQIKAKAKSEAEGYAAQIKLLEQQIDSEASIIEDGKEFRNVDCLERISPEAPNEVEIIRLDTGEVIATRPMTEEERQQSLFDAAEPETITISHLDENGNTVEVITTTPERLSKAAQTLKLTDEGEGLIELYEKAEAELEAEAQAKPEKESRELTLADYVAFARSQTSVKHPEAAALNWYQKGELVADVRAFVMNSTPEATPTKKRRSKIKLHDEPSYEAGL